MNGADEQLSADQQRAADDERAQLSKVRRDLKRWERDLARWKRVTRIRRGALAVSAGTLLTGLAETALSWGGSCAVFRTDLVCGVLVLLAAVTAVVVTPRRGSMHSKAELENCVEVNRDALRFFGALTPPSLRERRAFYREDVGGVIEQHRKESRKYRRIHNTLQNLVMAGSAATTTVAALDTGDKLTWQNVTLITIGLIITLATAFTGYYKYRERSYFLLQTADAIEEEANAFTLGVGSYSEFGSDEEQQALKLFTQRVEGHRNEQRRRQQQLDQPAEQTASNGQLQG
ncbi:DUF4231 domain-containing protein [Streptomyces lydicamycinicus]